MSRTISYDAWAAATTRNPTRSDRISEAINALLPELWMYDDDVTSGITGYRPWPRSGSRCMGMIWAGVSKYVSTWADAEGGRILDLCSLPSVPRSAYIRLSPAPADGIQFAFVPIRVNRGRELIQELVGDSGYDLPRQISVSSMSSGSLRMDKMAVAAVVLADPTNPSPSSVEFRRKLGTTTVREFMVDLMRSVYRDSVRTRNVLVDRDQHYVELIHLVANEAYPGYLNPQTADFNRLVECMNTPSLTNVSYESLNPIMYNIVMPQAIFDTACECLDNDRPPIIPQAMMKHEWMFNGSINRACTGLTPGSTIGFDTAGLKMVAGISNRSNMDMPGRTWYWPTEYNPPQEWIDHFVQASSRLCNTDMPLSLTERGDISLMMGRDIPVFFAHLGQARLFEQRFAKVTTLEFDPGRLLTGFTAVSCGPTGEELAHPPEATTAPADNPPGSSSEDEVDDEDDDAVVCTSCGDDCEPEDVTTCPGCEEYTCDSCLRNCSGCNTDRCETCHTEHAGCSSCGLCATQVQDSVSTECADCGELWCPDCAADPCDECGALYCRQCVNGERHMDSDCSVVQE